MSCCSIQGLCFSPKEITAVTWTNHDDVPHVVASADDQFKKSPALDTDQSFSHTLTTAGSYTYFCPGHRRVAIKSTNLESVEVQILNRWIVRRI
jgi:plastocyanin